jgi:AraC-like DNA-binding protein
MKGKRVLAGAVQILLQTGISLGLDRALLLNVAGIQEAELLDRDAYLPFQSQVKLGKAIIALRPGVNVGIAMLRLITPSTFGVLGYTITHSPTLREALGSFIRFQGLITDGVRWNLQAKSSCSIRVETDPELAVIGHPIEAMLGLWLMIGRLLTNQLWKPDRITFRHRPLGDPLEIETFFGCQVQFRCEQNELFFTEDVLSLPLVVGKASLQASMHRLAEEKLAEVEGHGTITSQLRNLLFEQLPQGNSNKNTLAQQLGMSSRTLNRRLNDEDTTYRDVLDLVRKELAESWLSDPKHAVYEIAYLLGYHEPSTFYRSFRKWTGHSPQNWRRRILGQTSETGDSAPLGL